MPGCVLHVCGKLFDPDIYLKNSQLQPYHVWHRGEAMIKSESHAKRMYEHSGFSCDVNTADGDLRSQLKDAETFLTQFNDDLKRLTALPTIEECQLDFGFDCRLGNGVAVQGEFLPVSFLSLVGQLNIAVALSLYPSV